MIKVTFDPAKRARTITERGLDFADVRLVLAGDVLTRRDDRFDYGEERFITAGYLAGHMVVFVWTPRGETIHVISMRYAHAKEERRWHQRLG